ncbi:hypothetical protein WAI453_002334 [Rhynchosporium graminicola]
MLEYLLSSAQVNATESARIGWVNLAYATVSTFRAYVRIAKFDAAVLGGIKKSVAQQKPTQEMFKKRSSYTRLLFLGDIGPRAN